MSLMHRLKWSTLPPGLIGGDDERCGHANREHRRLETALKKYGIEIPFPQRDLHIRSGQLPVLLDDRQGDAK